MTLKSPKQILKLKCLVIFSVLFQSVNIYYLMSDKLNMSAFGFLNPTEGELN